jgi:hypothetical protein
LHLIALLFTRFALLRCKDTTFCDNLQVFRLFFVVFGSFSCISVPFFLHFSAFLAENRQFLAENKAVLPENEHRERLFLRLSPCLFRHFRPVSRFSAADGGLAAHRPQNPNSLKLT